MSPTPFLLAGTMQASSSQYDSFLFWRQPIPELDLSELEEVGGDVSQPASKKMSAGRGQEEEVRREGGGGVEGGEWCWLRKGGAQRRVKR